MKKVQNLLLLVLSASLLVGCSKGWNNKSQPSQPGESEIDPSEDETGPGNYDITYPIENISLKPIDSSAFNIMLNGLFGTEYNERVYRDFLGNDAFDAILNSNYMKEEQISQLFNIIMSSATLDDEYPPLSFYLNLVDQLDHLEMDSAILTLRELKANERGYAGISRVIKAQHDLYEGSLISYQSANAALNGGNPASNPAIQEAAKNEYALDKTIISSDETAIFDGLFELIDDDGALGFFRFAGHAATCLKEYMTDDEIKYLVASMGGEYYEEEAKQLEETIMSSPQSMKDFFYHAGQAFTNLNLNRASWEAILPSLKKFVSLMIKGEMYHQIRPEPASNFTSVDQMLSTVFSGLRPVAVKSVIKFIGLIGENITEDVICAAMAEPGYPLTLVSTYYNRMFGLLTEKEKNNVDEAFFIFGVDIAKFNDDLNSVAAAGDMDDIQDLIDDTFAPMANRFKYEEKEYKVETSYGKENGLYLRQGDNIDTTRLAKIYRSGDFFHWSGEDMSLRSYSFIKGFDTSTTGFKTATIAITHGSSSSDMRTDNCVITYFVMPSDVNYFVENLHVEARFNGDGLSDNKIYTDGAGNKVARIGERIVLQKGSHFAAKKLKARVEINDAHMYVSTEFRYLHDDSQLLNLSETTGFEVDCSGFETSFIGIHYVVGAVTYTTRENVKISIPVYIAYEVVNELVSGMPEDDATIVL